MRRIVLILASIICVLSLYAQDARLAHPFLWKTYYNPAYAGTENIITLDAGVQTSFTYKPSLFVNSQFAVTVPFNIGKSDWGIGLKAGNDYEGYGLVNTANISVPISIHFRVGRSTMLQFGVEPDVYSRYINKSKLVFGDQMDNYYGKVRDESGELRNIVSENLWSFDLSLGVYGISVLNKDRYYRPIYIEYGFSVFHVLGANNQSFFTQNGNKLFDPNIYYRRFSVQLEYNHPIGITKNHNSFIYLTGYGIYEFQQRMHDIQFGVCVSQSKIGWIGFGFKVERYNTFTLSDVMIHIGGRIPIKGDENIMSIAYTFEMPLTQGNVWETSIHSLSLHFALDALSGKTKFACPAPKKYINRGW